ncbi:hypothetical protein I4U23_027023 [Adineta vaga]|nr:hypothetical protein I4U23_027023 [Adineta vaga]
MVTHNQRMSIILQNIDIYSQRVQFTDGLCYLLIILGFIGNIFGLLIFSSSRQTWRQSSTYVYLANSSSIINLFCATRYALILHSRTRIFINELVQYQWFACKLYEISFCFRVISSWITLFWMFERLTCISESLRTFCNRWKTSQLKFLIPCIILTLILVCVLGPSVYMYQPQIIEYRFFSISLQNQSINSTRDKISYHCGISLNESLRWQKYFNDMNLGFNHHTIRCFFSELFPAGIIILFNSFILYYIVQTSRRLSQSKQRRNVTSWMNIVLILHSCLFLSSLLSHIVGHFLSVDAHETWWVLLSVLMSCSLNFYVYCLSGRDFRLKILYLIRLFFIRIIYQIQIRKLKWKERQENLKEKDYTFECELMVRNKRVKKYVLIEKLGHI